MRPIKKALLLLATLGLTACGSTLHEKIMKGGTLTLDDFKDGYQVASDSSKLKDLKVTDSTALAKLKGLAQKLNAEEKRLINNKTITQCNTIIAKAKNDIGNMNGFYQKHKETLDVVRRQQADNTIMTGIAAMACSLSDDCVDAVADDGIKGFQELHSVMNDKIINDNGAKGIVTQYTKLEKQANAAQQRIASCQAKTQQIQMPYIELGQQMFFTCLSENWYDLSHDKNKEFACSQLVQAQAYKAYLK